MKDCDSKIVGSYCKDSGHIAGSYEKNLNMNRHCGHCGGNENVFEDCCARHRDMRLSRDKEKAEKDGREKYKEKNAEENDTVTLIDDEEIEDEEEDQSPFTSDE